jgi:redox-sensitive bicupin YhaK (pirin superfamily)
MIELRRAADRGHANHGWLDSHHSFSFGDYHDPQHMAFGPLRVINEDRVQPGKGFGTHGHRDMEILSWVLAGRLEHRDSLGNGSTIAPGEIQRMSAGRGVQHSEYNPSRDELVHFLQIWIQPATTGIAPSYEQASVPTAARRGRLALIAAPATAGGAVAIHQDARVYAGLFADRETASLPLPAGRRAYVHVARGRLAVNGVQLAAGDAVKLDAMPAIELAAGEDAEVLVFDLS